MIYDFGTKIPDTYEVPIQQSSGKGKHCFIFKCPDELKEKFGLEYKDLLLKVFLQEEYKEGNENKMKWGDDPSGDNPKVNTLLMEATKIQNICYFEFVAPRVHALVKVSWKGKDYLAQLTDNLGKEFGSKHSDSYRAYAKVKELGKIYGFENQKDDVSMWDVIQDKLIDFQTFWFTDEHAKKILEMYKDRTKWGKIYYHAIPEIGLTGGPRVMEQRIKEMELDKIDFKGKTVLDIGCSGGLFMHYALEHGAKRVVGLDFEKDVSGARLVSNELEYFNAEYYGIDLQHTNTNYLKGLLSAEKFDIVFFLSMFRHVEFPEFVWEMCGETAIIEWNNWKSEGEIYELVKKRFEITREGRTTDHGTGKPFYICKPKN